MTRRRPVIGVSGSRVMAESTYAVQAAGERNLEAVAEVADCLPLVIPGLANPADIGHLLDLCDGFLLTGGRANVHPSHYGEEPTEAHGSFDEARDALTLPLVRAAVAAAKPVFGICRGIQEMNVARGGTLYPEVGALPGRMRHRMPAGCTDHVVIFERRHLVRFRPGGALHRLLGVTETMTNSLHGQAVATPGAGVIVEGWAEDETVEAISLADAPGFALGVQWHAEYEAGADPISARLFRAFGDAARAAQDPRP